MKITVSQHPLLHLMAFQTDLTAATDSLSETAVQWLQAAQPGDNIPLNPVRDIGPEIRKVLRHCGFKPSGRSKPAAEYLRNSAGKLPRINVPVDILNMVSFHCGIPISVVDVDRLQNPQSALKVTAAEPGSRYVFNPSGQEMDIGNLICLHDAAGPCANAVKDSQRTKTNEQTTHTLSLLWGNKQFQEFNQKVSAWYREVLEDHGAKTTAVEIEET